MKFFDTTPRDMTTMIKVNNRPICLLTKYGLYSQSESKKGLALVQVSSFSALRWYATAGLYGGTKIFDEMFARMIDQQNSSRISGAT